MMVTTYFQEELGDITFEVEAMDEWKGLAEKLGLNHQLELVKGKSSPTQYPFLNTGMLRVLETLCPKKVPLNEFSITPIPLEVMRLAAMAINDNTFERLEVWYNDVDPDPFLIGINSKSYGWFYNDQGITEYIKNDEGNTFYGSRAEVLERAKEVNPVKKVNLSDSSKQQYLIAKWGDEDRSFTELREMAIKRLIEDKGADMQAKLITIQEKLANIKANAIRFIDGRINSYELSE